MRHLASWSIDWNFENTADVQLCTKNCRCSRKSEFANWLNWGTSKCISSRPRPRSFYMPQSSIHCISSLPFVSVPAWASIWYSSFVFRTNGFFVFAAVALLDLAAFIVWHICAWYVLFREMSVFIDAGATSGMLWCRSSRKSEFAR